MSGGGPAAPAIRLTRPGSGQRRANRPENATVHLLVLVGSHTILRIRLNQFAREVPQSLQRRTFVILTVAERDGDSGSRGLRRLVVGNEVLDGRNRAQVGIDRLEIRLGGLPVPRPRHGRLDVTRRAEVLSGPERLDEQFLGPDADAGVLVRSEVDGIRDAPGPGEGGQGPVPLQIQGPAGAGGGGSFVSCGWPESIRVMSGSGPSGPFSTAYPKLPRSVTQSSLFTQTREEGVLTPRDSK